MLKVLIVDDEILMRMGILSLIDWEKHGFQIIGNAENGNEAIKIIEADIPDILITDVVMPDMDGIELTEYVKRKYPDIHIIILSCHDDYSYVRKALRLGADDYLLKLSMRPSDLLSILEETSKKIFNKRKSIISSVETSSNHVVKKEEILKSLLYGESGNENLLNEKINDMVNHKLGVIAVKINCYERLANNKLAGDALFRMLQQKTKLYGEMEVVRNSENEFVLIIDTEGFEKERQLDGISSIAYDIVISAEKVVNVKASIGISDEMGSIGNLHTMYERAANALGYSFYTGAGSINIYDCKWMEPERKSIFTPDRRESINRYLNVYNAASVMDVMESVFNEIKQTGLGRTDAIQIVLDIYYEIKALLTRKGIIPEKVTGIVKPAYVVLEGYEFFEDVRDAFFNIIKNSCNAIMENESVKYSKEVCELIKYITVNHTREINLKTASEYIHLSDSYTSTIFKKQTGKSFTRYLNEIRMLKAIELLKDTDLPISNISRMAGYMNENYFGRLFKSMTGLNPSESRNKKSEVCFKEFEDVD